MSKKTKIFNWFVIAVAAFCAQVWACVPPPCGVCYDGWPNCTWKCGSQGCCEGKCYNQYQEHCCNYGNQKTCYNDETCCGTKCCHCTDTTEAENWTDITFTGIGGCSANCTEDKWSDLIYDCCGNWLLLSCYSPPCEYQYWCNGSCMGQCAYLCGVNYFQVKKNQAGCRFLRTRHMTRDRLPEYEPVSEECDEGTKDKYDWIVSISGESPYCREGGSLEDLEENWETGGTVSNCE